MKEQGLDIASNSRIFLLLLLFSFNANALSYKIFHISGRSFKDTSTQKNIPVIKNMMIYEGDIIRTLENSFLILKASDFSIHRIEENTKFKVVKNPKISENSEVSEPAVLEILQGAIFNEVLKEHNSESFQIKTDNVTFGVRGTKFLVSRDKKSNDLLINVESGEVEVKNQYSSSVEFVEKKETMLIEKDFNFTQKQKIKNFIEKADWDLNNTKIAKKSFRQKRAQRFKALRKMRSKWKPNLEKIKKKQNAWKKRKRRFIEKKKQTRESLKTKDLDNINKRLRRRQKLDEIRSNVQDRNNQQERIKRRIRKKRRKLQQ